MLKTLMAAVVLALTMFFAPGANACSQCMCGAPFPADVLGGVVPMQFSYGLEERYLSKENALDDEPGDETETEHRVAGLAIWRPWNRVAFLGRLPYNFKEITERPEGEGTLVEDSQGLGDAELHALAGLWTGSGALAATLGVVASVTAPTGSNNVENAAGERLEAHLQPGTGAWSGTAGLNLALGGNSGVWDASFIGRVSGTNSHGYHYGNALLYNAGFLSNPWKNLRLLAQVNGRSSEQDDFEDGSIGEHTGGTVLYAAPGLRWRTALGLTLEGLVQVPFYQNLYGEQTEHTTARFSVAMSQ